MPDNCSKTQCFFKIAFDFDKEMLVLAPFNIILEKVGTQSIVAHKLSSIMLFCMKIYIFWISGLDNSTICSEDSCFSSMKVHKVTVKLICR
jgi:hypothetical protein